MLRLRADLVEELKDIQRAAPAVRRPTTTAIIERCLELALPQVRREVVS